MAHPVGSPVTYPVGKESPRFFNRIPSGIDSAMSRLVSLASSRNHQFWPVAEVAAELAVVGHDDYRCGRGVEGLGEFVDERDRQVVGGFVEEHDVGSAGEGEGEVETALLAHGELRERSSGVGSREQPEGPQRHGRVNSLVTELVHPGFVDVVDASSVR